MSNVAIRVEGIGKRYRLGERSRPNDTLRDSLVAGTRTLSRAVSSVFRAGTARSRDETTLWALRDVSFQVLHGDVVGIIGANGAGKSTLLKILTRITEPTTGYAEVNGRVGSLLEVGTGFHPELTGRENIFLNGAILGMRRREILQKFDEIVDFAEVEPFLDTPVKRYSSGMYLRLAFAVAAHLEPDVLIVDEVLAVGDASFQKKCLGKMGDVARSGRPVLFVSHNMNAVQRLCNTCGLLKHGELVEFGATAGIVSRYLAGSAGFTAPAEWIDVTGLRRQGNGDVRVEAIRFESDRADLDGQPYPGGRLDVQLRLHAETARTVGSLAVTLYDPHGTKLVNADTLALGRVFELQPGPNFVRFSIASLNLNPGTYDMGFWVAEPEYNTVYDYSESAIRLEILDVQPQGLGRRPADDGRVLCSFQAWTENAPEPAYLGVEEKDGSPVSVDD